MLKAIISESKCRENGFDGLIVEEDSITGKTRMIAYKDFFLTDRNTNFKRALEWVENSMNKYDIQ